MNSKIQCVAFDGTRRIASGELPEVVNQVLKQGSPDTVVFNDSTGEMIDVHGGAPSLEPELRTPGRPKLGVVAREVTLLPRHWEWLNLQPGGASVALRKLVDEARRVHRDTDRVRLAKEAAYRFATAMAGNEQGFEEAIRGLFAGDAVRFAQHSRTWPEDVREHATKLAARVFEGNEGHP